MYIGIHLINCSDTVADSLDRDSQEAIEPERSLCYWAMHD